MTIRFNIILLSVKSYQNVICDGYVSHSALYDPNMADAENVQIFRNLVRIDDKGEELMEIYQMISFGQVSLQLNTMKNDTECNKF
jgi:hypothetical protein